MYNIILNFVSLKLRMKNTLQIEATIDQAIELGLRADEFEMIKEILGRTPNFTETAIY